MADVVKSTKMFEGCNMLIAAMRRRHFDKSIAEACADGGTIHVPPALARPEREG